MGPDFYSENKIFRAKFTIFSQKIELPKVWGLFCIREATLDGQRPNNSRRL